MKRNRIFATLLAGILCLSLAACSPSEQKPAEQKPAEQKQTDAPATTEAAPAAQTVTWGDWTVDVPAEWELKGGDVFDANDTRYFSVKKSTFKYFDFKADGEEQIMTHYNYNKNAYTNEQKDVNGSFGGNDWVGFQYSDGYGGYGFEAYTTVDGEMIRVSAVGFSFDDEMVKTVLSSLKHTPAARAEQ